MRPKETTGKGPGENSKSAAAAVVDDQELEAAVKLYCQADTGQTPAEKRSWLEQHGGGFPVPRRICAKVADSACVAPFKFQPHSRSFKRTNKDKRSQVFKATWNRCRISAQCHNALGHLDDLEKKIRLAAEKKRREADVCQRDNARSGAASSGSTISDDDDGNAAVTITACEAARLLHQLFNGRKKDALIAALCNLN